jgi:hypothetical protein
VTRAGAGLASPLGLAALVLLVVNDHVLKAAFGSWWTGKLSDLAGLVVAPLVVQATWEFVGALRRRVVRAAMAPLWAGAVAAGGLLAAIKVSPAANRLYEVGLGAAQWLPAAGLAALRGHPVPARWAVESVSDPTDLLALPVLALVLVVGARRASAAVVGRDDAVP